MEILNNGATFGEQRQKINDNFTELDEGKQDAEIGKSLVNNDEILRLASVTNQDLSGLATEQFVADGLTTKQPTLDNSNIKTINGESVLGSGNITISSGGSLWTEDASYEAFGALVIRKILGYYGGVGVLPTELSENIGKYNAKLGGYTSVKADATTFSGGSTVELSQTLDPKRTTKAPSEKATADYVKLKRSEFIAIVPEEITAINTTGYVDTSATNNTTISPNSSINSTNIIAALPNEKFILQGVTTTATSLSILIKCYDASGNYVIHKNNSVLTLIESGIYLLTIPSNPTITNFICNFYIADKDTISIKKGSTIYDVTGKIKASYLPIQKTKLSEFLNDLQGLAYKDEVFERLEFSSPLILNKYTQTTANKDTLADGAYAVSQLIQGELNDKFVLVGLTSFVGAFGNYFKEDGSYAGTVASAGLVADGSSYVFTVNNAFAKSFRININLSDAPNFKILKGTSVADATLQFKKTALTKFATSLKKDREDEEAYHRGNAPKPKPLLPLYGIISAGQSNIEGRVPNAQAPVWIDQSNPTIERVKMWDKDNTAFRTFKLGENTGASKSNFAFDMISYYKLQQLLSKDIYVVKEARGGTAIDPLGTNGGGYWNAFTERIPNGEKLLENLDSKFRLAKIANPDVVYKCFIWHQGEGDSEKKAAINYYQNLKNVIAYVRGMVGNPKLPFIYSSVPTNSAQFSQIVKDAMVKIASEDAFAYYIDNGSVTLLDPYHFDAAGAETIGTAYFDIMKTL